MSRENRVVPQQRFQKQRNEARFTMLLAAISVAALLYYYAHQQILLYGDAVAHLNIARRVVDNRHPASSYGQLGTVWLPLQHIAMLPFVWVDTLWRSGIAGAIPGMVAYVLGALGIFRLVSARAGQFAAYLASATYAINPNLLYLQTTAMNEPIFLAFFIWSVVWLDEFLRAAFPAPGSSRTAAPTKPRRALEYCGIAMAAGALTRYDGWFSAAILGVILTWAFILWRPSLADARQHRFATKSFLELLLLNALVPVYWLVYTWAVSGNALDFATGPYSAKAIALRSTAQGSPPYPGQHHPLVAALYFLKAAQLNMGAPFWGGVVLAVAFAGTVLAAWRWRRYGIVLLFWLPLAFYALSIAYGSVPVYIPVWYPFSYYNVRYGLELLPVFAIFPAILADALSEGATSAALRATVWCACIAVFGVSYGSAFADTPITLREAQVNSQGRLGVEQALAGVLQQIPQSATLLMYEAEHAGALRLAGIPLRHVISEAEHPDWELALLDPAHHADYAVACGRDPVWAAVEQHDGEFTALMTIHVPGQSQCIVYKPSATSR